MQNFHFAFCTMHFAFDSSQELSMLVNLLLTFSYVPLVGFGFLLAAFESI